MTPRLKSLMKCPKRTKYSMNDFKYSDGAKRFHTLDWELKRQFGKKTVKLPLDVGMGCPNRDGTKGCGGCIFCSDARSGEFTAGSSLSIPEQINATKKLYSKWPDAYYIPYFQAGSNTYAPTEQLRKWFDEALSLPDAVGLDISTRPDCINEEIADLLAEYNQKTYLTVELGLQSAKDETLGHINRGHTFDDFLAGYKLLADRKIRVCIHIIDGLPGETKEDMLNTVREIAKLEPYAVKIHLLHIIKGTPLEAEYTDGKIKVLEYSEYIDIVCDQIELLPPETVIARLTGDGDRRTLIAPLWSLNKRSVLNGIDKELARRDSWQGKYN